MPSTLYAGTGNDAYKSTDSAGSWSETLLNTYVTTFAIDPTTPSIIYAGTYGGGVSQSTNGGATWAAVNTGLSGAALSVFALTIDPATPSILYAGTGDGVYKSMDSGGTGPAPTSTPTPAPPAANVA